jgi:ribonuclease HII
MIEYKVMNKHIKIPHNFFEKKAWANNTYVCGIDEVGRGCLAGPLVVGAVILPIGTKYRFKDSKLLTANEREKNFTWITKHAYYSTAIVSNILIDKINIYQATVYAMKRAYLQLIETIPFEYQLLKYLVTDAIPLIFDSIHLHNNLEINHFPFGESISTTIAAASIVAKVTRDQLMNTMAEIFPAFSFHKHKGYGTKQHLEELTNTGQSLIHRISFLKSLKSGNEDENQQSLFE